MRKIIHLDMDAFFAAVEMRDNPALRNVPMAVGGSSDRRGVLATSNYEARKYGVRSAMATAYAMKLCPHLVLVRANFKKYSEASEKVFEIFHEFTDKVEGLSLDEAFLDVTDSELFQGSATLIAQEIRKEIFKRTQLTASAGIGPNKLIAKLASDINKP
ncbi:MAG: DNA polymerase IV, partial [Bdellovibrionales bacterium]|nr:DNA polymerase IV [Bdellovibrionales bacterium]